MRHLAAGLRRRACGRLGHWPDVWQPRCLVCHAHLADTDEHPTVLRRLFWRRSLAPTGR